MTDDRLQHNRRIEKRRENFPHAATLITQYGSSAKGDNKNAGGPRGLACHMTEGATNRNCLPTYS